MTKTNSGNPLWVTRTSTAGVAAFATQTIGTISLPAGKCVRVVRPTRINKDVALMDLRQVTLKPVDADR